MAICSIFVVVVAFHSVVFLFVLSFQWLHFVAELKLDRSMISKFQRIAVLYFDELAPHEIRTTVRVESPLTWATAEKKLYRIRVWSLCVFGLNANGVCISVNQLDVAQHKLPIYENGIRSGASLIRCEFYLICVFSHRCTRPVFLAIPADRLHFFPFHPSVLRFPLSARSECGSFSNK